MTVSVAVSTQYTNVTDTGQTAHDRTGDANACIARKKSLKPTKDVLCDFKAFWRKFHFPL